MTIGSQSSIRRGRGAAAASGPPVTTAWVSIDGFRQGVLAAVAEPGPRRIRRNRRDVPPAALTLDPACAFDRDAGLSGLRRGRAARAPRQIDLRNDEEHRQLFLVLLEECQIVG